MKPKSALLFPGSSWLIEEPVDRWTQSILSVDEFCRVLAGWSLESNLRVEATAGGLLVFDFSQLPGATVVSAKPSDFEQILQATRERVRVINCFALCLHSAASVAGDDPLAFRVTHEDLVSGGEDLAQSMGGPGLRSLAVVPNSGFLIDFTRIGVCSEEALARACEGLDRVIQHADPQTATLVELLNEAMLACSGHNFESAIVTAWTICEVVLSKRFAEYGRSHAEASGLSVTKKRLLQWDRMPAATVIESLLLAGRLPIELEHPLANARRRRNDWVHGATPISFVDARDAIRLAQRLLKEVLHIDVAVRPQVGISV